MSLLTGIVLEMLAVHPDAQGDGAGEILTRWGTAKADEKGVEVGHWLLLRAAQDGC